MQLHVTHVYIIMQKRGHDSCGNSTYKAGRESSSRFRTQDETGLGSGCCRHLNILVTGNLKTGESYRFVHHFHHILWGLGYLYLCYDVICNYSTFAEDVAKLSVAHPDHDDFKRMCSEMTGFLQVCFTYFYYNLCMLEQRHSPFQSLFRMRDNAGSPGACMCVIMSL